MRVRTIRSLGFDWPGSESMKEYAVQWFGFVNLDRSLAALRRGLEVYDRQLRDISGYQRRWGADDADDGLGEAASKACEMRAAIALIEAIKARAR